MLMSFLPIRLNVIWMGAGLLMFRRYALFRSFGSKLTIAKEYYCLYKTYMYMSSQPIYFYHEYSDTSYLRNIRNTDYKHMLLIPKSRINSNNNVCKIGISN
jgi:hypothetical protein